MEAAGLELTAGGGGGGLLSQAAQSAHGSERTRRGATADPLPTPLSPEHTGGGRLRSGKMSTGGTSDFTRRHKTRLFF